MSNKDLPMMPLFPQDFLTATQLWKFPARGAYILLLMYEWILDELPNDTEQLSRLVGMEYHEFEVHWPVISKKFDENENGALVNQRLKEHRYKSLAMKKAKKQGAAITNGKRWGRPILHPEIIAERHAERFGERHAERVAERVAIESQPPPFSESPPSPSPSPSPIQSREDLELGDKSPHTQEEVAQEGGKKSRVRKKGKPIPEPDEFLEFKLAFPERSGDYRWQQALHSINARIEEGHTWDEIIKGAHRYAAYCNSVGKTGSEYVMQASRFVGPDKSFQLPWRVTSGKATTPTLRPANSFDEWHAKQTQHIGADKPK